MGDLDRFFLYFLIFLNIFALLGLVLSKNKKPAQKSYKFCPCKQMAQNGSLSTICIYSAIAGFFYSVLSMGFVGILNLRLDLIFLLTIFSAYLGWKLKLD